MRSVRPSAREWPEEGASAGVAPRLLSVRLQGFKSFAGRTHVEFGSGISAVVGPNGSGKSNLADALRWALGEQGRSLRTRKSEDVIWAGSDRRPALGMADVTLVLDNADGLLNVDFAVVELGRRLYRSGENDYLLNRQRVRLRDLVELLDAAHLAENAFLFIGQGMVDQALALRPEERRPLFEEVAGVRRHERRRRKAEEQLAESEANLARVEDILGELRPQARRLAVQAEQQATRETAANELAAALVAAAHARWHEAARRVAEAEAVRDSTRGEADAAMSDLTAAEAAAASVAAELSGRVATEVTRREEHERARAELTELRVREARLGSDTDALARDRERLTADRERVEADLDTARRDLASPIPARDRELEAAVAEADAALGEALAELANLRAATRARGEELAALRRAAAARGTELETARRRLADAERRAADEAAIATRLDDRRRELASIRDRAEAAVADAVEAENDAGERREAARREAEVLDAAARAAIDAAGALSSRLASLRGRLEELEARVADEETRGIARAARRRGGRRVDEEIEVDPQLRAAVQAALGGAARAYALERDAVTELVAERGMLVVTGSSSGATRDAAMPRELDAAVESRGGGRLAEAVRRDPLGAATALLGHAVWLPDLDACLAVQAQLPSGWIAVPRDGSAVVTALTVTLGRGEGTLDGRAEMGRLAKELDDGNAELDRLNAAAAEATAAADAARGALAMARQAEGEAQAALRRAEGDERIPARELETTLREAAWHAAQADRLATEVDRLRASVAAMASAEPRSGPTATERDPAGDAGGAVATWESRAAELRARRDRLAADLAGHDARRGEAEHRRASAEAAIALEERRLAEGDRALAALAEREERLAADRRTVEGELIVAVRREEEARAALDALRAADADSRQRLGTAEGAAVAARERLRRAEDRLRAAERTELEARLGLDALREQLLVELAGLGELGLRQLVDAGGVAAPDAAARSASDDDAAAFEDALAAVVGRWATETPSVEPPSAGRLASLRRRFHELGAANPFAVTEYEALRTRLDDLESQERDLRTAIVRTRQLIDDLNALIATQFRTTFEALEAAFDARFRQLFGGGFAHLSLTEPNDLSATGVDIVARPPGKKPQALAMLSGGERALTAVALLFAMLEVRPVPFCVLDEVDAALDEANIGRFTTALRELAQRTQFVVITHNRGTIEASDALYGVTVGDDSVSRVISLRLDEAESLAREGSGAGAAVLG